MVARVHVAVGAGELAVRVLVERRQPERASRSWSRQYKAVIFYHDEEQRNLAVATRDRLAERTGATIHTEILPYDGFYLAEPYHQKYRLRSVRDIMAEFSAMYPLDDDFVNSTAAARVNGYVGGYGSLEVVKSEIGESGPVS